MNLKSFAYAVRKEQVNRKENIFVGKVHYRENGYEQIAKFNINHLQVNIIAKKSHSLIRHLTVKVMYEGKIKMYKEYTYTKYNQMIESNLAQINKDLAQIK